MAVMGMMMRNPKRKRNATNTTRRNNKIWRKTLQTSHLHTFFPQVITRILQHPIRWSKGDGTFCFGQKFIGTCVRSITCRPSTCRNHTFSYTAPVSTYISFICNIQTKVVYRKCKCDPKRGWRHTLLDCEGGLREMGVKYSGYNLVLRKEQDPRSYQKR